MTDTDRYRHTSLAREQEADRLLDAARSVIQALQSEHRHTDVTEARANRVVEGIGRYLAQHLIGWPADE